MKQRFSIIFLQGTRMEKTIAAERVCSQKMRKVRNGNGLSVLLPVYLCGNFESACQKNDRTLAVFCALCPFCHGAFYARLTAGPAARRPLFPAEKILDKNLAQLYDNL